ncbi:MAG TPA: DUF488 domain-containing protein [Candidatus Margulisiibacteriota bacterium]|nr:DUF488 domain-containing protein [Candidatus Margulisiibacteriota bacterium]
MAIKLKRAYEPAAAGDGVRYLVERLWPRGMKKTELRLDAWLKDVAPSSDLRQWFSHDPAKWREFRQRYFRELQGNTGAWEPLLKAARRGTVTLLYSARDTEHNNAVALKEFLEGKLGR